MTNHLLFRVKKKLLTMTIKNNIIKDSYKHNLTYNYLYKKNKSLIDSSHYDKMAVKETKKIWVCWFQGLDSAPDIVKTCFNRLKNNFSGYDIVLITEKNFKDYVQIPEFIIEKWKKGIISYTHFSDILRTFLLADVGGIWVDSTVYVTASSMPKYISDNPFFAFKEINLDRSDIPSVVASSWFIKSNKNNPILLLTKDLICEYWKKSSVLIDYYLFHLFFAMSCRKYNDIWDSVPTYNNVNPHVMQFELFNKYNKERFNYYAAISDFHKLTYKFHGKEITKDTNIGHILGDK